MIKIVLLSAMHANDISKTVITDILSDIWGNKMACFW